MTAYDPVKAPVELRGADGAARLVRSAAVVVAQREGGDGAGSARAALPRVLSDVPVAILLIDQEAGTVTYANDRAVAMAGAVRLPTPVDTWGAAAGLRSLGGEPLAASDNPLSLVASGRPVAGEPIRAPRHPAGGDDARGAADGDQLLWATGFPLSRADSTEKLALVVLLEVTPPADSHDAEQAMRALRERAIVATDLAFTITDPRQDGNPLVWVNPSFTSTTGYTAEEVLGRNCRLLQGPATEPAAVAEMRAAVAERRSASTVLLNYRKDGTAFWNHVSISPVFDGDGELVSFVGVQSDVTQRVEADRDLRAAHAAEQAARAEADESRRRLGLLAKATSRLIGTLDVDAALDGLLQVVVPELADWAVVTLIDSDDNQARVAALRHRDGRDDELARFAALQSRHLGVRTAQGAVLASGEPRLLAHIAEGYGDTIDADPEMMRIAGGLGLASALVVPLAARERTLGVLALLAGPSGRSFTQDDLDVAADLARRAALALDNARLYQREHHVAETLQRSLLPQLPDLPDIGVAAQYVAGDSAAYVGGDFYEVLDLPDGAVAVAVGDVVGHDLAAAAQMGHLRGLLRACAWDTAADDAGDPATVLSRVDALVQGLHVAPMATLVYARLERPRAPSGPWLLRYSNAGHPHGLLRAPDGSVRLLDRADGLLLGVTLDLPRDTVSVAVARGSLLLLYTDGLIERRGEDLDASTAALVATVAALPVDAGPEAVRDAVIAAAGSVLEDDVAVVALQLR